MDQDATTSRETDRPLLSAVPIPFGVDLRHINSSILQYCAKVFHQQN